MAAGALRAGSLRLVNTADAALPRAVPRRNAGAAPGDEVDPRWVLAVACTRLLEGGRAAILPVEARERVVRLASHLGLRAFDAALVIAIVQDAARRGEPLGGEVAARLLLLPVARERAASVETSAVLFLASIFAAAALMISLIAWVVG
jgi:hypothetical protein